MALAGAGCHGKSTWNIFRQIQTDPLPAAGRTLEWRDSQIAATAIRFGASLATRNARHFAGLGLDLVDPFTITV